MKKRATLTLPYEFYETIKYLPKDVRGDIWDIILEYFFDDEPIDYTKYSEQTRTAIACMMPDLRKMQVPYENGSCNCKKN